MTERPNIALVTWDSVRADHMPFHGYERNTAPFLDNLASNGLVFEDAQVPAVGTPASFTGMFAGEHGSGSMEHPHPAHWRKATAGRRLLPEALQDAGYHTGGFHFNALMSAEFGWDRGWDVYEDGMWGAEDEDDAYTGWKARAKGALDRAGLTNFAVDLKRMADGDPPVAWTELWDDVASFVADAPEPWFLWVLLIDTHHPYYAPSEYHEWAQPGLRRTYAWNYVMRRHRRITGERRPAIVNAYDNTIRCADAFVERLAGELDRAAHGDAPLIVHSDHGDEFGEHANYGHRPLMYDTVTRVPLVMRNVGETGRVEGPTSLLDLGSTVLDLAGSEERLGGRASLLGTERVDRDYVTVRNELTDGERTAAAVGPEWKVCHHPEGDWGATEFPEDSWEAYHRPSDPGEQENRWGEHPDRLEVSLREVLEPVDERASEPGSEPDELSSDTENRLRELGYVE